MKLLIHLLLTIFLFFYLPTCNIEEDEIAPPPTPTPVKKKAKIATVAPKSTAPRQQPKATIRKPTPPPPKVAVVEPKQVKPKPHEGLKVLTGIK